MCTAPQYLSCTPVVIPGNTSSSTTTKTTPVIEFCFKKIKNNISGKCGPGSESKIVSSHQYGTSIF
jgi:hypothetical protein